MTIEAAFAMGLFVGVSIFYFGYIVGRNSKR